MCQASCFIFKLPSPGTASVRDAMTSACQWHTGRSKESTYLQLHPNAVWNWQTSLFSIVCRNVSDNMHVVTLIHDCLCFFFLRTRWRSSDAILCSTWALKWNKYVKQNSKQYQEPTTAIISSLHCPLIAGHEAGSRHPQCQNSEAQQCTLHNYVLDPS